MSESSGRIKDSNAMWSMKEFQLTPWKKEQGPDRVVYYFQPYFFLLDNVINKSCKTQKERNTVANDGKVRRS
jgi:hypothetical protein